MVSFWAVCPTSSLFCARVEARAPLQVGPPTLECLVRQVPSSKEVMLPTKKEGVCEKPPSCIELISLGGSSWISTCRDFDFFSSRFAEFGTDGIWS